MTTPRGHHDEEAHCECVADHRPAPLEYEWHHIWPIGMGGDPTPVGHPGLNGVWICPTTHTNTHELLRLFVRYGPLTWGDVGDLFDRPVSRYAFTLAHEGYRRWHEASITVHTVNSG